MISDFGIRISELGKEAIPNPQSEILEMGYAFVKTLKIPCNWLMFLTRQRVFVTIWATETSLQGIPMSP